MPFIDVDVANAFETAALPGQGDVNAGGGGLDTSSMTNEAVLNSYGLDVQSRAAMRNGGGSGVVADNQGNLYNANSGRKVGRAVTPTLTGNPIFDHPIITIILIVVVLFIWKFAAKEDHEEERTIKVSLSNMVRITLMAAVGILILKWFFGVYAIASISPTIEFL